MTETKPKVIAALPTRGFIYAQTIMSLQKNMVDDIAIVPGLPIPDCHNAATKEALNKGADYVWLVEEDMVYPDDTLEKMLAVNGKIVVCDYSLGDWRCTSKNKAGTILFGGTGCMLVKKEVFDEIPYPWFETDKTFDVRTWEPLDVKSEYGGQDVYFCYKARKKGITIEEVEDFHVNHLRCKNLERVGTNNGVYQFWELNYENAKPIQAYT